MGLEKIQGHRTEQSIHCALEWPLGECGRKLVIGPITNNRPILLLIIGPSMDGSHTMEGICKF